VALIETDRQRPSLLLLERWAAALDLDMLDLLLTSTDPAPRVVQLLEAYLQRQPEARRWLTALFYIAWQHPRQITPATWERIFQQFFAWWHR
jgi:hypothetical protein